MRKRIYGIGVPTLLVAGYVGYWHYLESELQRFIDEWIADQREAGVQVTHGTITTGGFPLEVYADIPAPALTATTGAQTVSWQGETLRISFVPWDFLTYRFDSPGEHLVAVIENDGFAKWALNAQRAGGSWAIDTSGGAELKLDIADVAVTDALAQNFSLGALDGTVTIAPEGAPADQAKLTATVAVSDLVLPEAIAAPFDPRIATFTTDVTLQTPVLPPSLPVLFLVLRDYDGRVVLRNTRLAWGELDISTEGELRVDAANYPAGRFPTRVTGYAETIRRLQDAGLLGELEAVGLAAVAGAMAQNEDGGRPTVSLVVELIDGLVKVQDIAVMQMAPLPVPGAQS
ncbi:MAG: DUF2125 domain-containing protein [Alphaproteobacteria bacterium]